MEQNKNKIIAKNTVYMFIRMVLVLTITLYSSRIILHSLGTDDYGIYSVVAGFISMLSFLSGSMANCTQRYYNYSLGTDSDSELVKVIQTSFVVQTILIIVIIVIAETLGLWFVNNKLNFPGGVTLQIQLLYQFAIFNFLIKVIQAPYKGMVMAKERMNVIAIVSIVEAVLILCVSFIVGYMPLGQKVWLYAAFISLVYLLMFFVYVYSATKLCDKMKFSFSYDMKQVKEMSSFVGWNIFGQLAGVIRNQGVNILLNVFFTVVVNTARGLAAQLQAGVNQITNNISVAIQPQIVQSYAMGNMQRYMSLMYFGCKSNYLLLWLITLPIFFCTRSILTIWLGNDYPLMTEIFVNLILVNSLVESFAGTISTGLYAYGKIRNYQLVVSLIVIMTLPISYMFLKIGYGPASAFVVGIVVGLFGMIARILCWRWAITFSVLRFCKATVFPCFVTSAISFMLMYLIMDYIKIENLYLHVFITVVISIIINIPVMYGLGLNVSERIRIRNGIKNFINRIINA